MKKTLIALMALAGVASAELATNGFVYGWDFATGSAPSYQATGATQLNNHDRFTLVEGAEYAKFVGANCLYTTNMSGFGDGNFTISISVQGLGAANWLDVWAITTSRTVTSTNPESGEEVTSTVSADMELQLSSAGDLMFYNNVDARQLSSTNLGNATANPYTTQTDWVTITLVSDSTNGTLTLYKNGVQEGTASDWDAGAITRFSVGYNVNSGSRVMEEGYLDNLYVWNRALNASEVAAIPAPSKLIPEPTTATLSLLALAGLAARRRRKQALACWAD